MILAAGLAAWLTIFAVDMAIRGGTFYSEERVHSLLCEGHRREVHLKWSGIAAAKSLLLDSAPRQEAGRGISRHRVGCQPAVK